MSHNKIQGVHNRELGGHIHSPALVNKTPSYNFVFSELGKNCDPQGAWWLTEDELVNSILKLFVVRLSKQEGESTVLNMSLAVCFWLPRRDVGRRHTLGGNQCLRNEKQVLNFCRAIKRWDCFRFSYQPERWQTWSWSPCTVLVKSFGYFCQSKFLWRGQILTQRNKL